MSESKKLKEKCSCVERREETYIAVEEGGRRFGNFDFDCSARGRGEGVVILMIVLLLSLWST